MKRFTAMIALIAYLATFTEVEELFKLPMLIEHYSEHKQQVNEMSFIEFLVMHYETDVSHDDHDMRLPFKTCQHSSGTATVTMPEQQIALHSLPVPDVARYPSFYSYHIPGYPVGDIFQPPKS